MHRYLLAAILGIVLAAGSPQAGAESARAINALTQSGSRRAKTRPAEQRPSLDEARDLYWHGRYAEAIRTYRKLLDSPGDAVPAAIGLAEAYRATGRYDQALETLRAVSARSAASSEWQTALAEALATVGKYDEALSAAKRAHELRNDWAPAIFRLGQALETLGEKKQAVEVYKGLERAIAKKGFQNDPASLVAAGRILDRYAILTGQKASDQAQNILQNYFQRAYQEVDGSYWPAHLAAGAFLLSKHKPGQAAKEFALAAKINKHLPAVAVGQGRIALQKHRFEQALALAGKALRINPRHGGALLLNATTLMAWRKFDEVGPVINRILQYNPNHLQALSMLAALHMRTFAEEQAARFIRQVRKINPNYAELHEVIGHWLAAGRQFEQAEKHYQKAIEMAPELAGPVTGLGQLYMQTGEEQLARATLKKAFSLDNYRSDVLNYLKLLEKLADFELRRTPHFIIKVDGEHDAVLLDQVAEIAEKIHAEVTADFDHTPVEKTLVEIFPNHAQFSVRITGRGWIGTIGACTGRVIAMPAPDPLRGGFGSFNWAVVLRHEYTHTVTLSATKNRIPHWFTEACAVWEQPDRRNFEAVALLVEAVRTNRLFPVKSLDWGFVRPRRAGARSLAYAQSEWMFEYIVQRSGYETIIKMLKGFRDGLTQGEVFRQILAVTEEQFDKDFRAWAVKQIASWGFSTDPLPTLQAAGAAAEAAPGSADAQANLALALLRAAKMRQAEAAARKALRLNDRHRRALAVLGYVLSQRKNYGEALEVSLRLEAADPGSATAARIQAECHLAEHRWLKAISALETFKLRRPLDPYSYEKLAELYGQLAQPEKALPNLIELHRRTMKEPKYARQIAETYRTLGAPEKALEFWEQVIQINPYDAGAYKAMAGLLLREREYDRSILAMRSACKLEPDKADSWAQLAAVYYRVAKARKSRQALREARVTAEKALQIDPASPAVDLLERIEAEEEGL